MSSGIVTIATGSDRYYTMAKNLLHSVKIQSPNTKVAVITDQNNPYAHEFDDVVILDAPYNSYLDKLDLLIKCPYDENIFLDADSLVYKNIDYLWPLFRAGSDFSYLGERLALDSAEGFFEFLNVNGKFEYPIHYIPRLHGGLYYVRPGEYCSKMWELCMKIKDTYQSYHFKIFKEPADEPIFALAAAVMDSSVVERINDICFLPVSEKVSANFLTGQLDYVENGINYSASILHFSNHNTEKAFYKDEVDKIQSRMNKRSVFLSKRFFYHLSDSFGTKERAKCTLYEWAPQRIKDLYHYLKRGS